MRRPLTAVLSLLLLALGFSFVALETATAAPPSAKPKPTTKVVTAPIDIWKASAAQTPGGPLDYCAVVVFAVFPEIAGWEATEVDWVSTVTGPGGESLAEPYSDTFTWGPLTRNAPAGHHQAMLGGQPAVWQAGSPDCEAAYAKTVSSWPTTAQVTYEPVATCASAIDAFNDADQKVTAAKKKVDRARTAAQLAAARAQLTSAKAKLAKARKKFRKKC